MATANGRVSRRHPAEVTIVRLGEAAQRWGDRLDAGTLDEISHVIYELDRIVNEDRES